VDEELAQPMIPNFAAMTEKLAGQRIVEDQPILPVFSLRYDRNGIWIEKSLAIRVLTLFHSQRKPEDDFSESVFVLLCQFLQPSLGQFDPELLPIIQNLLGQMDRSREFYSLLVHSLGRLPNPPVAIPDSQFSGAFVNAFFALNNYCDQPPASLPTIFRDLVKSFSGIRDAFAGAVTSQSPELAERLAELQDKVLKGEADRHTAALRYWKQLWQKLAHNRSPFFLPQIVGDSDIHFKRAGIVDHFLRPKILKLNAEFDVHAEASINRDCAPDEPEGQPSIPRLPSYYTFRRIDSMDLDGEILDVTRYVWKARCELVKVTKRIEGTFTAHAPGYSFTALTGQSSLFIAAETVDLVFFQYVAHHPTAIEIVTTAHKSYFFNFPDVTSHKFVQYFRSIPMVNARFVQSQVGRLEVVKMSLQRRWVERDISTFEYLMMLNVFSGRSTNNIQAYPIFPWVLADYSSETLDFSNPRTFRDLSKPIGALNEARLEKLKSLRRDSIEQQNFLYQSPYSSRFAVLHFLVRLEPFTSAHIAFQDGKFDAPSRMFTSIAQAFDRVLNFVGNFRELIPEFFYCPEFLRNDDNFDLGSLPDGTNVHHIVLPPWAASPEDFIYKHRMALESDYVSLHLHEWIDLIWGYKQRGESATEADNTFDPRLYEDVWNTARDPLETTVIEEMLALVGSIPLRLFEQPHPKRKLPTNRTEFASVSVTVADSAIVDVKVVGDSTELLTVFTLHSDGRIFVWRSKNSSISVISKERFNQICAHSSSAGDRTYFAFARPNSSELSLVRSNGTTITAKSTQHIDAITCSAFIGSEVITSGKDAILVKWRLNERNELENSASLMVHSDVISCIHASSFYGIVLSCSIDGLMVISVASDFSFLRSIDVKCQDSYVPSAILTARSVGRIVVCCSRKLETDPGNLLCVYTLNGTFVGTYTIQEKITAWCTITRSDGYDFFAVADETNAVSLVDAYNMAKVGTIYQSTCKVTLVYYQRRSDAFVIGTETGTLIIGSLFR
jgi:WD40 repeat protein